MSLDPTLESRQIAWQRAIETFGTAYIFERRMVSPRRWLTWITWLGLAVPISVGGLVTSFGVKKELIEPALIVAGILATVQALLSLMAITSKWDDVLSYSLDSARANTGLSRRFEELGRNGPSDIAQQLRLLEVENQLRTDLDNARGLTERERRIGMRAGLRQFRRKCAGCCEVPTSMASSRCPVCGNF